MIENGRGVLNELKLERRKQEEARAIGQHDKRAAAGACGIRMRYGRAAVAEFARNLGSEGSNP
jgi:hypothetical protein